MHAPSNQAIADLEIVRLLHERRVSDLVIALADMIEREGHQIADASLTRLDFAVRSARAFGNASVKGRC